MSRLVLFLNVDCFFKMQGAQIVFMYCLIYDWEFFPLLNSFLFLCEIGIMFGNQIDTDQSEVCGLKKENMDDLLVKDRTCGYCCGGNELLLLT